MRSFVSVLIFLSLAFIACQNATLPDQIGTDSEEFHNQFFTLDFQTGRALFTDFTDHFFTTFPHDDPTQGMVVYDRAKWTHDDMIDLKENDGLLAYVKFRDDMAGFDSFRFTTKSFFNLDEETQRILFVFKGSFPSEKGIWPAWWLNGSLEDTWTYHDSLPAVGDELLNRYSGGGNFYDTGSSVNSTDWPGAGEIDIIENINGDSLIYNTLHTCPQMCNSEWNQDGSIVNCANAKTNDVNPGCSGMSYSVEKLAGTFACLWEPDIIRFYYWEPGAGVKGNGGPLNIQPDPGLWNAHLKNSVKLLESDSECDDALHQPWQCKNCNRSNTCQFKNMKMIFNVTLCGTWAGNLFDSTENALRNCEAYITHEGKSKIDNQFMKIEYVSVKPL